MIFRALPLTGAYEITLERRDDARGYFARAYCADEFAAHGLNTEWVQMNISMSHARGTMRGLHFQRPPMDEVKLVRCLKGRVLDVIVDLRAGSDSFGRHCSVTLDAERFNAIYIPAGFAHGFQTLTPDCALHYMHSQRYAPGAEGGVNPCDPALGIDWPLPLAEMSARDRALPDLNDCEPL